jgi:ABC-type sugar transport system permease subunit
MNWFTIVLIVLGWLVLSAVISIFIGKCIAFGMNSEIPRPDEFDDNR